MGRQLDRLLDPPIGHAAAEVAVHRLIDFSVSPLWSRIAQSRGPSSGPLVVTDRPLILNVAIPASPVFPGIGRLKTIAGNAYLRAGLLIDVGEGTPSGANDGT